MPHVVEADAIVEEDTMVIHFHDASPAAAVLHPHTLRESCSSHNPHHPRHILAHSKAKPKRSLNLMQAHKRLKTGMDTSGIDFSPAVMRI